MVGDFSVGKTSLIRRFVDNQFSDEYLSTVGVKLSRKVVELPTSAAHPAGQQVELLIWDIEGQTQFKAIAPSYLQGAKGAIIVGDVKRPETLTHLQDHLALFFQINPQAHAIVALNKVDLVSAEVAIALQEKFHLQAHYPGLLATYGTSAKTGADVNHIFQQLATQLLLK